MVKEIGIREEKFTMVRMVSKQDYLFGGEDGDKLFKYITSISYDLDGDNKKCLMI